MLVSLSCHIDLLIQMTAGCAWCAVGAINYDIRFQQQQCILH